MESGSLRSVEAFIGEHLAGGLPMNTTDDPGRHAAYIVEAAQRRGLRVQQLSTEHYCFFGPDGAVGAVKNMVTSLVSSTAVSAANSKHISKQLFLAGRVPVPQGRLFARSEREQALAHMRAASGPVVVKPDAGRAGDAVTTGVVTEEGFGRAWEAAASDRASVGVIVEEEVAGIDIRALVVAGKVVAAASRVPAFVIGDGRRPIAELVEAKRSARRAHRYLARLPIVPDEHHLASLGHSLESVPAEGEVVVLNGTVNLHQGGESIDVTELAHPGVLQVAADAAACIPGLGVAGIDLMVPSLDDPDAVVVLEANSGANLSVHHLPAYGASVDVGAAIVDEMLARAAPRGWRRRIRSSQAARWFMRMRFPAGSRKAQSRTP